MLLLYIPKRKGITPIGLTDKYMSCHSIKSIKEQDGHTMITVKDGGIFAFHGDKRVKAVYVEGQEAAKAAIVYKEENGLYCLDLSEYKGEIQITVST